MAPFRTLHMLVVNEKIVSRVKEGKMSALDQHWETEVEYKPNG